MRKVIFIGLIFILASCYSTKNIGDIKQVETTTSTGHYVLSIDFVTSRHITDVQLMDLQTYTSEGVVIIEKVTPEIRNERPLFFKVENGDAVDVKQFSIKKEEKQAGYRGEIKKMEEIQFVSRFENIYTFETQNGIQMHFKPNGTGTFILQDIDNFTGEYSSSKFYLTKILFRYRKKIEQIFN